MTKVKDNTDDSLTLKQKTFVLEYLSNGFNATKAAISAGYSEKTAQEQGSRLLSNVMVVPKSQRGRMRSLPGARSLLNE
jgi:phage terminase small subunit